MSKIFSGDGTALVPAASRLPATVPAKRRPRVPEPFDGIQSNSCRNAACANFGVEPLAHVTRGRAKAGERIQDGYRLVGHNKAKGQSRLRCMKCGEHVSLKSNVGIKEEFDRIGAYLKPQPALSCQNERCVNHRRPVDKRPRGYHAHGRTAAGAPRYKCKGCGATITGADARRRQDKAHKNRLVFELLINKSPIKAIARVADLSPRTIYDKIDFIHEQCLAFAGVRERELPNTRISRLYISTDRQDYVLNWTDRKDRRNTQLTAIGSADNRTGYVFGMHLNFDPLPDPDAIEHETIVSGDYGHTHPYFRRHARLWLELDHKTAQDTPGVPALRKGIGAMQRVQQFVIERDMLSDPEAKERITTFHALPRRGMQVHFAYTAHAHFRLLRSLIGTADRVRFFMDQDDTLRAACVSAFAGEILLGRADAFFVQIDKTYGIDTRRELVAKARKVYNAYRARHGVDWSDRRIRQHMIREQLETLGTTRPGWRDRWIKDPEHTLHEPDKAVCWITDRGGYSLDHLAVLITRASLHGIDRYFMQLRRLLSMLERPISTPSNYNRVWHGYSPYNPEIVQKLLDIFRVHYNFVKAERPRKTPDGLPRAVRTPAMKLGLAKGQIRTEDILYFRP